MKATHLKISQQTHQTHWTTNRYGWRLHLSFFLHPDFTFSITIPHKNQLLSCAPSSGEGKGEHHGGWSLHPYLAINKALTPNSSIITKRWNVHPYLIISQRLTSQRWRGEGKKQKTPDAYAREERREERKKTREDLKGSPRLWYWRRRKKDLHTEETSLLRRLKFYSQNLPPNIIIHFLYLSLQRIYLLELLLA